MNLEEIKKEYYEENDFAEKEYVNDKKNQQLNRQFEKEGDLLDDTFHGYYFESGEKGYDFYQKKYPDFTNEEFKQIIRIQNQKHIKKASKDIHTMKNIMIFWFILTIINIFVSIIALSKTI